MKFIKKIILLFLVFYFVFYFVPFSLISTNVFYDDANDKLWSHRMLDPVNNEELIDEFKGFEVDVFYNIEQNKFDVRHGDLSRSYSLDEYFSDFSGLTLKI